MKHHPPGSKPAGLIVLSCWAAVAFGLLSSPSTASAQKFDIKPVAEKKIEKLPAGPLFWRIENFSTLADAQAAAGPTGLAAEVAGKVWLFTLGPKARDVQRRQHRCGDWAGAPDHCTRISVAHQQHGRTAGGQDTRTYACWLRKLDMLSGQLSQESPHGTSHVDAGASMPGHGPGMPMEVSSSGTTDLNALVMFVAVASKPFSSQQQFPEAMTAMIEKLRASNHYRADLCDATASNPQLFSYCPVDCFASLAMMVSGTVPAVRNCA